MGEFFKTFVAVIIANIVLFALVFGGVVLVGVLASMGDEVKVKDGSYLVIDIYGQVMAYHPPGNIIQELVGDEPETLHRILTNLKKAAHDDRIDGVIFKLSSSNNMGAGMMQEIRAAIDRVQAAGKKVYAYSDALDRSTYYVASTCDGIYMPPSGALYWVGMGGKRMYLRGFLDKIGVTPQIHKIKDYKSAAEMFLRKDMSDPARENMEWLLDDFWDISLGEIAADRGLTVDDLVGFMEEIILSAKGAREAGLIDEILYWDEVKTKLRPPGDDDLETIDQASYSKVSMSKVGLKGKKKIAVVHAHGLIGGRESRVDPTWGPFIGHRTVAADLRRAADDDDVEAIVFRVDSNGGESLASDLIRREVERIVKDKPVIVSMVDIATSGGYLISYHGTKIVADPLTITGSIGSIYGKFYTERMYNKLGITFDGFMKGPNAAFWSESTEFTEEQWDRFKKIHFESFNDWLSDVADRRGMTFDEVEQLAHGRVWTGRQAKENGLIDELGDLERAIEIAKEEAGIDADEQVTIYNYPSKRSMWDMITSGGPFSTAKYMLYRFIHSDLKEAYRLMTNVQMNAYTGPVPR